MAPDRGSRRGAVVLAWSISCCRRKQGARSVRRRGVEDIMLRITLAVVIAGLALFGGSAQAQTQGLEAAGPSDSARFTFHRVQDIFLRLDLQTGQVSQCSWVSIGWFCRVVPDERGALESEIARLQNDNIALKKELLARGLAVAERDQARAAGVRSQ